MLVGACRRRDRGQATVLLVVATLVVLLVVVAVTRLGDAAVQQGRARAAADAAALAAAVHDCRAATRVAAANGARLLSCADNGASATVSVVVGAARATARAVRAP